MFNAAECKKLFISFTYHDTEIPKFLHDSIFDLRVPYTYFSIHDVYDTPTPLHKSGAYQFCV
jgi:hypothetical protein